MHYLLITTKPGKNPGDQFIRLGVEKLVRTADPSATFELLDKEDGADLSRKRPFDKCILCGMPLFWSNEVSESQTIGWWGGIFEGWPSERKRDFLVLGAGSVMGDKIKSHGRYVAAIMQAKDRAFALTTRQHVIDWPDVIESVCPSVFNADEQASGYTLACNLMPSGAHDSHLNEREASIWRDKVKTIAEQLIENYVFVAHNEAEEQFALSLGFHANKVAFAQTAEEYLAFYRTCRVYIGNRLHGAQMVATNPSSRVMAIGYDSRMKMLERFGVYVRTPSEVDQKDVRTFHRFTHGTHNNVGTQIAREWARNLRIVQDFIRA